MAKTASDFQHNILLKLANTGTSHAFYVSPLTLSKTQYEQMLFSSTDRYHPFPYYKWGIVEIHQERWTSYLGLVPFLRGHVSIVPHENVSTDEHYYSFSNNGTDIAWHSPKLLTNSSSRLSDRLKYIFNSAFTNSNNWTTPRAFLSKLEDIKEFDFVRPYPENDNDIYSVEKLVEFGRELYQRHNIRQFLLLTTKEFLNENDKLFN